jgi:hypothetical protein
MRTKKLGTIGQLPPRCKVQEVPTSRTISTLSTISREKVLFAMLDKIEREKILEKMQLDHNILSTKRREELEQTKESAQKYIDNKAISDERHKLYASTGTPQKIGPNSRVDIVAAKSIRTMYGDTYKVVDKDGVWYWTPKKLSIFLSKVSKKFVDKIVAVPYTLSVETSEQKSFVSRGKTIEYVDIRFVDLPEIEELENTIAALEEYVEQDTKIQQDYLERKKTTANNQMYQDCRCRTRTIHSIQVQHTRVQNQRENNTIFAESR